jgi:hypothetical protein
VLDPALEATLNDQPYTRERRGALILFFCVHYGIFTVVHGAFVSILFGPFDLEPLQALAGALALIVSHGVSYYANFIGKGEYKKVTETILFVQPYKRIIVLHVSILAGAFLTQLIGAPILALALFVFLKTAIDLWAHTRERGTLSASERMLLE